MIGIFTYFQRNGLTIFLLCCFTFTVWVVMEEMKISDENRVLLENIAFNSNKLEKKVESLTEELRTSIKDQTTDMKAKIQSNRKEFEFSIQSLLANLDKSENIRIEELEYQINLKVNTLERHFIDLKESKTLIEGQISEIRSDLLKLQKQFPELQKQFSSISSKIVDLETQNNIIYTKLQTTNNNSSVGEPKNNNVQTTFTENYNERHHQQITNTENLKPTLPNIISSNIKPSKRVEINEMIPPPYSLDIGNEHVVVNLKQFTFCIPDFNLMQSSIKMNIKTQAYLFLEKIFAKLELHSISHLFIDEFISSSPCSGVYLEINNQNWDDLLVSNWSELVESETEEQFELKINFTNNSSSISSGNGNRSEQFTPTIQISSKSALGVERALYYLLFFIFPPDEHNGIEVQQLFSSPDLVSFGITGIPLKISSIHSSVSSCEESREYESFLGREIRLLQPNQFIINPLNNHFTINLLCNNNRFARKLTTTTADYQVYLVNYHSSNIIFIHHRSCSIANQNTILSHDPITQNTLLREGSEFYRISIVGKERFTLYPVYNGGCTYYANYTISSEGHYFIDIVRLYIDWSGTQESVIVYSQNMRTAVLVSDRFSPQFESVELHQNISIVFPENNPKTIKFSNLLHINNSLSSSPSSSLQSSTSPIIFTSPKYEHQYCELNYFTNMDVMGDGRLIFKEEGIKKILYHALSENYRAEYVDRVTLFYPFAHETLSKLEKATMLDYIWSPNSCKLRSAEDLQTYFPKCLYHKKIAFIGDSHMKYFYFWTARNMGYHESKLKTSPSDFKTNHTTSFYQYFELNHISENVTSFLSLLNEVENSNEVSKTTLEQFDIIILNAGNYQFSSQHKTYKEYESLIVSLLKLVKPLQTKLIWMQTPPIASFSNHYEFSSKNDWRSLSRIYKINQIADNIMKLENIPRLPFFAFSSNFDITPDLIHHDWPEYANLVHLLFNLICTSQFMDYDY